MKINRFFAVLILLSLLLLTLSGCGKTKDRSLEEFMTLMASLTNLDGTGEIYINMPYDKLSNKLDSYSITSRKVENSLIQAVTGGKENAKSSFAYQFGKLLASLHPEQGFSSADGLVQIKMDQSKEGLAKGDNIEKLKQLYPDYVYLQNSNKEAGNAPYFLRVPVEIEGWFIKEFWQSNGNLIVSAIEVSGPAPSDTVSAITIKFLPASVAREQNWLQR